MRVLLSRDSGAPRRDSVKTARTTVATSGGQRHARAQHAPKTEKTARSFVALGFLALRTRSAAPPEWQWEFSFKSGPRRRNHRHRGRIFQRDDDARDAQTQRERRK